MFKSGFISIMGRPNAGKSTLLNTMLGEKIAAVSSKPQTTRTQIMGVLTRENCQFVFVDTPGIHKPKNKLGKFMVKEAVSGSDEADIIIYMIDSTVFNFDREKEILDTINAEKIILVINKIDKVEKESLLPIISKMSGYRNFDEIIPVSALKKDGVDRLLNLIEEKLPEGPKFFPDDTLTDQPEKQIAADFIREKIMRNLNDEIPFGIAVTTDSMKYDEEKNLTSINAVIYCERDSHKAIIIGKKGEMIKKIGSQARNEIERFTKTKVFLELWVKVKDNWRNSDIMLKNFGYKEQK
ncbi:MAG: GTPase Era [Clostridia bacterium]|nr:GTPase Era [Clostridia bacterium]